MKPRIVGRIDLKTGKWIYKTKWYYLSWLTSFEAWLRYRVLNQPLK